MPGWLIYVLLFVAPLLAGLVSFFLFNKVKQGFMLILSFSGAYLFSVTVLHLIPEAFGAHGHGHVHNSATDYIGLYVLLGFFIQLILEQFSKGVEHGHVHADDHLGTGYVMSVMIGLSLHSYLEGLPLGGHFHEESARLPYLFGVSLHKIPESFALVSILHFANIRRQYILLLLLFYCSISPLGVLTSDLLTYTGNNFEQYHPMLIAVVIGLFFHVSTTILFETSTKSHKFSSRKIFAIIAGVALSLLTFNIH